MSTRKKANVARAWWESRRRDYEIGEVVRSHFTQRTSGQHMKLGLHSKCNADLLEDISKTGKMAMN